MKDPFSMPRHPKFMSKGGRNVTEALAMTRRDKGVLREIYRSLRVLLFSLRKTSYKLCDLYQIVKFILWSAKLIQNGNLVPLMKEIKRISFAFRVWAVSDDPSLILNRDSRSPRSFLLFLMSCCPHSGSRAQVARWGRALPTPTDAVVDEAIESFVTNVTSVNSAPPLDEEKLSKIMSFGHDYFKGKVVRPASFLPPTATASRLSSRLERGRLGELIRHNVDEIDEYLDQMEEFRGVAPPLDEGLLDILRRSVERDVSSKPLVARILAVKERGFKTRVLSLFSSLDIIIPDVIMRQVMPILLEDPNLDFETVVESCDRLQEALTRGTISERLVVSSDLSNATDLCRQEYAQALWLGILEAFGYEENDNVTRAVMRLFSPIELKRESGSVFTNRGWHMGTPLSFITLSLLHKFCVIDSGNGHCPYFIRGDDCIGIFSGRQSYFDSLESLGFKINKDKTILSTKGGVFCEGTFRFSFSEIEKDSLLPLNYSKKVKGNKPLRLFEGVKLLRDVPLKGLLSAPRDGSTKLYAIGSFMESIRPIVSTKQMRRLTRFVTSTFSGLISQGRRLGLPLFCEQSIGGFGLPFNGVYGNLRGLTFHQRAKLGYACSHRDGAHKLRQVSMYYKDRVQASMVTDFLDMAKQHFGVKPNMSICVWEDWTKSTAFLTYKTQRLVYESLGTGTVEGKNQVGSLKQASKVYASLKENSPKFVPGRLADVSRLAMRLREFDYLYLPPVSSTCHSVFPKP
nr:TPA_asm: RNA-dependent RNA polymerase [Narnavirus forcipomyiae]